MPRAKVEPHALPRLRAKLPCRTKSGSGACARGSLDAVNFSQSPERYQKSVFESHGFFLNQAKPDLILHKILVAVPQNSAPRQRERKAPPPKYTESETKPFLGKRTGCSAGKFPSPHPACAGPFSEAAILETFPFSSPLPLRLPSCIPEERPQAALAFIP